MLPLPVVLLASAATPPGCVCIAGGAVLKGRRSNSGVVEAGGVILERLKTTGGVAGAGCEADEGVISVHGITVRQARVLTSRLDLRRKREASESDEEKTVSQRRPVNRI